MSLQYSNQDPSLEDEKVKKEDGPSSLHLSTRWRTIQTKKNLAMTYQKPRNVHYHSKWKILRTPSTGSI